MLVTGNGTINHDFGTLAEQDLRTGEMFGVGIALVILVLVFGALVTAVVPLILAVASIVLALGLTSLVGQVMDLSFFITNMITMIGLAMGIDYSLFVVSRYREERAAGRDKIEAIARAASTASRSVTVQRHGGDPGPGWALPGALHPLSQPGHGRHPGGVHRAARRPHPAAGPARRSWATG